MLPSEITLFPVPFADGWDGGRNNFVNGYHDNRMAAGNTFSRGPPRMERGRGGVGGGYRGNRGGGAFNPMNPAQPMAFTGYEAKGAALVYQSALLQTAGRLELTGLKLNHLLG